MLKLNDRYSLWIDNDCLFLKRKIFSLSRSDYVCRETFETFVNVNTLENKVLVFFLNIKYKNNITIHPKWNPFPTAVAPKLYLFLHILPHEDMLHTFHICDATNELMNWLWCVDWICGTVSAVWDFIESYFSLFFTQSSCVDSEECSGI